MIFNTNARAGADIYIDLGTANTLIATRTRGIVANEPSVIAYRKTENGQRKVVAVGDEARAKVGRTPGNLVASFPLKDGVIADLDTTESMLRYFMARAQHTVQRFLKLSRPRVVISLPFGVSDIEKKAVKDAGRLAGARDVVLIEELMAAAIGANLPVHAAQGNMIIDIGGGTTEIAIISLYGIVHCEAVRVGGHAFDEAIVSYMRRRHNLVVGEMSAERIKIDIGSALSGDHKTKGAIRGIDFTTGLPREIQVSAHEIHEAFSPLLTQIYYAGRRALEAVPPDFLPDILREGVRLAGGGALIHGLAKRLEKELGIPVGLSDEPLLAVARGGQRALTDSGLLERIAL